MHDSSVTIVRTQSLILPTDLGLRRDTMTVNPLAFVPDLLRRALLTRLNPEIHRALQRQLEKGQPRPALSWFSHRSDKNTVIYDVFRTFDDKKIIAICPSLRNLEQHLFPLTILVEGQETPFQYRALSPKNPVFSTYVIEMKVPQHLKNSHKNISLEFRFKTLTWHAQLKPNAIAASAVEGSISLITKQKNNPIRWIKDWCLYYHRVHGIQHVFLYNYGENTEYLAHILSGLAPKLKITLCIWNFPFGIHGAISEFAFLNHAHYLLGATTPFRMVLDIDEYLVNPSSKSLATYLQGLSIDGMLNLRIPGMCIPPIYDSESSKNATTLPRVFNFPYQTKMHVSGNQYGTFPKVIFTYKGIVFVSTHFVEGDETIPAAFPDGYYSFKTHISTPKSGFVNKLLGKIYPAYGKIPRMDSYSEIKNQEMVTFKLENLYYNHYLGLNTGWQNPQRLLSQKYDPQIHTTCPTMSEILKIANLEND